MADLRTLTLALVADIDKFKKGLDKADNETKGFSDKLKTALKAGAAAFAAIGAAAGAFAIKIGKDAIGAASDFNEELSKSQVVFGDAAAQIDKFARTAATRLGQSRTEALRATSNFALFGKQAGLSGQELVDFSTDFTELASDLASFNNTSPEDAIQALGAALRGESEPIRRYQVLLDDATLRQRAFSEGITDSIKTALTPQQKVLAASKEIFAQTAVAQGDFARTSEGLANQQRILAKEIENLKISLGEQFLPAAINVATFIREELIPRFTGLVNAITGKPDSLTTAIEEGRRKLRGFEAQQLQAERQGFNLGESYITLGESIANFGNALLGQTRDGGGFKSFLDVLISINEAVANFINSIATYVGAIRRVGEAVGNLLSGAGSAVGIGSIGAADQRLADIAANQRRPNTQPVVVNNNINVRGAIDAQGTARTITKVLTQQRAISGVRVTAPSGFF